MADQDAANDHEWAKDDDGKVRYSKYLQLDKILGAQKVTSNVHDEHLFVVIHQVYELWFAQIRHEISSMCDEFGKGEKTNFLVISARLGRVNKILKLLVEQIPILETMSPQDFLEFRDNLFPASGFQSYQFRIIEYRIGFNEKTRTEFENDKEGYKKVMSDKEREEMEVEQKKVSLFTCIEKWLESWPELDEKNFNFPAKFEQAILASIKPDEDKQKVEKKKSWYYSLIKQEEHDKMVQAGSRRFSQKAFFGALMTYLYRDHPRFHVPYQILNHLIEMDTLLMKWRYAHMCLVQYQIGNRPGTGGTSGVGYLQQTIRNNPKFFPDLMNMTTFFITKEHIPKLN
ncbi:tryptophan 2,3-dioxygenase-like [Dysidea avara]|uniref:tryptophan 2,3-dioxygenase-like n=1 Tax=Dysidea avara TaxID=196820 RepID=UPI00332D14F0